MSHRRRWLMDSPGSSTARSRRKACGLRIESLEARQLLCGEHLVGSDFAAADAGLVPGPSAIAVPPEGLPPVELGPEPFRVPGAPSSPPPTAANGLPLLESKPGAPAAIYLDLDGFTGNGYGGQQTHNPYSIDGDGANYNAQEQLNIIEGWRRISAYFAPFDVNVTTVVPTVPKTWTIITPSFNGPGYSWGQFNGFAPSSFNPQGDLLSRTTGILHEIGHDFGLAHQSEYDLLGNKTKEYRNGYDSLHGAIMGVDYDGTVPKWYIGHPSSSPSVLQDDIAIIASKIRPLQGAGGDGFRADDHGNTIASATVLANDSGLQSAYGIIERLADRDVFAFTSTGGPISIDATRDSISGVDIKLEVYAANGTLLAASDTTPNNQQLNAELAAGTYYAVVSSHGDYSDIGPYNLAVQSLPDGWKHQDVGNVGQAGYVRYDNSTQTFSLGGSGTRIGETSDSFHFAYQQLTGDGEIISRVTSIENTNGSAKSGVMIRQALTNNSPHAYMLATPTSGNWLRSRTVTAGASSDSPRTDEAFAPIWVRLVRAGNTITGYSSANGTEWTLEGSTTINNLPSQVFIGLATTATNNSVVNDSTYTNVTVIGNVSEPTPVVNALPAPTNLAVTNTTSTRIDLAWDAVPGATGYTVERSLDGTSYQSIGTTNASTRTFGNSSLTNYQRYFYRVRANDAAGVSVPSAFTSGLTRPGAVSSFTVTSWTETQLILNWRDRSGETGYRVERSADGTNFTTIATVGVNIPGYTDSGLSPGTTYSYRVVTLDGAGDAATSTVGSTSTRLTAVNDFELAEVAADHISLAWTDIAGEANYVVERSTDGEAFSTLATLPAGTTSYRDETVDPLGEYHYRVRGMNGTIPGTTGETLFTATPGETPLPSPWTSSDVGSITGPGASGFEDGTFTVISSGSDLSGTTDIMHFVRQTLVGDGTIVARLASIENTEDGAEIGLMVRETLNNNSKSFAIVSTPASDAHLRYRTSTGGSSTTAGAGTSGPQWLKLIRAGNVFTAFTSADGVAWSQLGSAVTIAMTESVFVGLASTSGDSEVFNTSTFDNVVVGVDGPIASSDAYSFDEDTVFTTGLQSVLANDFNFGGSGATVTIATQPTHGSAALTTAGALTYTPNADFYGTDSLTYQVTSPTAVIVAATSRWKYLDNGSNQGTAWRNVGFNDAAWASGPAELGYGDGDETTTVASGPTNARFATTYFRKTVTLPVGVTADGLSMRLRRDDAAAVYLNGVEVYRDANLPAAAEFDDYATSSISNTEENSFISIPLPGSSLLSGENVIAVEVHQGAANSSDLSFSLELSGRIISAPTLVTLEVAPTPDAPVAVDDAYEVVDAGPFDAATPGVLANDVDVDGDSLTAVLRTPPAHGSLTLSGDGSFRYTPNAGFAGDDAFTYQMTDGAPRTLVAKASDWRYLDTGLAAPAAWRTLTFDDAAWEVGAGELGYGDDDEATTVNCGPTAPDCNAQNFATTYFRHKFTVDDPTRVDSLMLELRRDDAAIVYLNGQQIFRDSNLPAIVGHATFATESSDENATTTIAVAAALLVAGENILAVEVHQAAADSSDISFDLGFTGRSLSNTATVTLSVDSTAIEGDFNGDVQVNVADIDLLLAALHAGSVDPIYDVSHDGEVTLADLDFLVTNLVQTSVGAGTWYGDVDLDGDVDRTDAAVVSMQFGRTGTPTWASGDWDASGTTDLADMAKLQANLGNPATVPVGPAAANAVVMGARLEAAKIKTRRLGRNLVATAAVDSIHGDAAETRILSARYSRTASAQRDRRAR